MMAPGENRTLTFATGAEALSNADEFGQTVLSGGKYGLEIGDVINPAVRTIQLNGPSVVLRKALF